MALIVNINDDFVKQIVFCISSAVTDDIMQDTRRANMNRNTMNSYSFRIWDLINRNVYNTFKNDSNIVVGFTKRGVWNMTPIFDKSTGLIFTLMREERFLEVKRNRKNHQHYVYELARAFNADIEIQQQSIFELERCYEKIQKKIILI